MNGSCAQAAKLTFCMQTLTGEEAMQEFTCRSCGPWSHTFGRFYKRVGPDGPLMRLPPAWWWSGSRTTGLDALEV